MHLANVPCGLFVLRTEYFTTSLLLAMLTYFSKMQARLRHQLLVRLTEPERGFKYTRLLIYGAPHGPQLCAASRFLPQSAMQFTSVVQNAGVT